MMNELEELRKRPRELLREPEPTLSETTADMDQRVPAGQDAMMQAGLVLGMVLMGIQLWMLTIALEMYLSGESEGLWELALVSGLIFLGGIMVLRLLPARRV